MHNEKNWKMYISNPIIIRVGVLIIYFLMIRCAEAPLEELPKSQKHRIIVLTDIGGDVDDMQSLTHFLMYADQFDIEGLIATSPNIILSNPQRPPDGEPQPHYIVEWVKAYGQVRENLMKHSEGWPETEKLLGMIKKGTKTGRRGGGFNIRTGMLIQPDGHLPLEQILGEGKDTEASDHIIEVVDRDDPRPVWISVWGGSIDLAQALWRVRNDRSIKEVEKFVDKLRVYAWGHQDMGGRWIQENFPDLFYIVSTGGIVYSADVKLRNQEWLDTNVRFNHGPLGALCPLRRNEYGAADSETYLGLIPNGLSAMEHPDWGGWGGRFQKSPTSEKQWIDLDININPESMGSTISRWAPHFQNDFQARMDWCVQDFKEANHPPTPVLNGDASLQPIEISARAGDSIVLDATGSVDIDKNELIYQWKFFPEAGTYSGQIDIENANSVISSFIVPDDALGKDIHIILEVTDNGSPQLTRYRRAVVHCNYWNVTFP